MALGAARPAGAGITLLVATVLAVFIGTRFLDLNPYLGGLALLLNGFFAAIFWLAGVIIAGANQVLKD